MRIPPYSWLQRTPASWPEVLQHRDGQLMLLMLQDKRVSKSLFSPVYILKKTCAGNILHFPNCFNKPPKGRLHGDLSHGVQQQCIRCSLKSKTFGTRPRATLPLFKVKLEKFGATALIKILAPIEFLCFGLHLSPVIFILFWGFI